MNFRRVFRSVGGILLIEGVFLLLPVIPALVYGEFSMILSFIIPAAALAAVGFGLYRIPQKNAGYYAKEGFFIVGLSWVLMALFGALPFVISGVLPHYVDALFESASGFTTTGATMFPTVENLPKSILFWRAENRIGSAEWGSSCSCLRSCPIKTAVPFISSARNLRGRMPPSWSRA